MFFNLATGDDLHFAKLSTEMSAITTAMEKYYHWSSRQLIEGVLYFVAPHTKLWRILNTLIIVICAKLLSKIFNNKRTFMFDVLSCLIVLTYPLLDMSSAGWMATSNNYFWPLCAILGNVYILKKIHLNQNTKKRYYIVGVCCLLFAANQEQGLAILWGIYFFYIIYCLYNSKKIPPYVYISVFFLITMSIYIFTCPGNWIRKSKEVQNWFGDFNSLSLIKKLEIGFDTTFYPIIFNFRPEIMVFSLSLVLVGNELKDKILELCGCLIMTIVVLFGFLKQIVISVYPNIGYLYNMLGQYGIFVRGNLKVIVVYFLILLLIISAIIYIVVLCKYDKKNIMIFIILLLGIGSKIMMGLSPTVWASGDRTGIFLYFSILIVSYFLVISYIKDHSKLNLFIPIVGIIAFCNLANCII